MEAIFVFLLFIAKVLSQNCTLDVSDPESPFVLTLEYDFPTYYVDQTFSFSPESLLYVECPKGTQSPYLAENGDRLDCKGNTTLMNLRTVELIDWVDIKCKSPEVTTVERSDKTCASGTGTIFDIGFNIYMDFLPMITICFDEKKLTPIYVNYTNEGSVRTSNLTYQKLVCQNQPDCSWTDSGKVYSTIKIDQAYTNQAQVLQDLGITNVTVPLLRFPITTTIWNLNTDEGHQPIQKAPYYDYLNVVPVWDTESFKRLFEVWNLAMEEKNVYIGSNIHAGGWGVATLAGERGEVGVYLADETVPVPKWIWMVWEKTEVIFFYYNSPVSGVGKNDTSDVCNQPDYILDDMFTCPYGQVVDPELQQLIKSNFV